LDTPLNISNSYFKCFPGFQMTWKFFIVYLFCVTSNLRITLIVCWFIHVGNLTLLFRNFKINSPQLV
jgi:hypothetical protein